MAEKGIQGRICHAIHRCAKIKNKYMKNYDKNIKSSYLMYLDAKKLYGWAMPQTFSVDDFEWKENIHKFNEEFNYVLHIRALKQALNHELILKKVHRIIQFNQEAWLKPYIDMNTKLWAEAKNDFENNFFKLMNNFVFGKAMKNVRKHRDIKSVTTDKRRNQSAAEPNYHTTKYFSKNLMKIQMKKDKSKNE